VLTSSSYSVDIDAVEEWRPIDGWPYEVSGLGRVRRASHVKQPARIMTPDKSSRGYFYVKLTDRDRSRTKFSIHGLVALAFIGPRPQGCEINHRDGDKANNRPSNLEYLTHAENMRHGRAMGLFPNTPGWKNTWCAGERHYGAKLTERSVREIRRMSKDGVTYRELARRFGVASSAICDAVRKHTWAHVE
jgi:hypothetical protein